MNSCDKIPPEQLLLAASTIALALTTDKSQQEIESLINLINLLQDMLVSILTQRAINQKALGVDLNVGDISIIP